jgi:hypothetical protein
MAAPHMPYWLQFVPGLPTTTVFDPASDTIVCGAVCGDPDTPLSSLRSWVRFYDPSGRYIRSSEMQPQTPGSNFYTYTVKYTPAAPNSKLRVQFGGSPTGGVFRLKLNEVWTGNIAYGDTTARQAAVVAAHPDVGSGNVVATWNAASKYLDFEFVNGRGRIDFIEQIAYDNKLSGSGATITASKIAGVGSGDIPTRQGQYLWDVVSFDGSRWSGDVGGYASKFALGPKRVDLLLDMPAGIASTSPASGATINTPAPLLSWTYATGTILAVPIDRAEVVVTNSAGARVWSGVDTSRADRLQVPLTAGLRTGQTYTWTLAITKASGRTTTVTRTFTVSYSRPASLAATLVRHSDGAFLSLTHAITPVSAANFVAYVAKIRPAGVPEDDPRNVEVFADRNRNQTFQYITRFPRNRDIIISFYVRQMQFGVEVDSVAREFPYHGALDSLIVLNSRTLESVVLSTHRGRDQGPENNPTYTGIWDQEYPLHHPPLDTSETINGTYTLPFSYDPVEHRKLVAMYKNPDLTTMVVSDALGNVWDAAVNRPRLYTPSGGGVQEIDVSFQQIGRHWFGGTP